MKRSDEKTRSEERGRMLPRVIEGSLVRTGEIAQTKVVEIDTRR